MSPRLSPASLIPYEIARRRKTGSRRTLRTWPQGRSPLRPGGSRITHVAPMTRFGMHRTAVVGLNAVLLVVAIVAAGFASRTADWTPVTLVALLFALALM